ncbi:bifunctional folylpolyglutamate synthase/dihydrofolate synthase [bacterium]|nr:MAG: bifunctional folylpolyglutamate synthase/dihydrofolate synthase [bacterium]
MTYRQAVQYLETFINYEKVPTWPYKESCKLERIKDFLSLLDNPQYSLKCLHVAGTKGKGSTCAFLAYILRQAGYRVGLYTSPHLSDFRERIRILTPNTKHQTPNIDFEGMISEEAIVNLVSRLKPAIEQCSRYSKYGPLSFFEIYTVLGFIYFKEKKTDFVVLETGLGGRLDATNTVSPLVCAITPISYEHTQKLGNTLQEIAAEKAGIIKSFQSLAFSRQPIVISAPQEKAAMQVIRRKCRQAKAKLYEVGKQIIYRKLKNEFRVRGIRGQYPHLKIKLIGEHQLINAAVAIGVIESLRNYGTNINVESIRSGLYNVVWPGRCEVIARNPQVVLDGAQNVASMRALKKAIKENFRYKRLVLILGISNDKDIKGICSEIGSLADEIILTRASNPRAACPRLLADYFRGKSLHITNSPKEAKKIASRIVRREDLILVTGSLFVVGEFRNGKA